MKTRITTINWKTFFGGDQISEPHNKSILRLISFCYKNFKYQNDAVLLMSYTISWH